jgi:hypothetical protein
VRAYLIEIDGESTSDANVRRSLREVIRVRNDLVTFGGAEACPS